LIGKRPRPRDSSTEDWEVKPKILFVYQHLSTFVKADLNLLKTHFEVIPYEYTIKRGAGRDLAKWMTANRKDTIWYMLWFGGRARHGRGIPPRTS